MAEPRLVVYGAIAANVAIAVAKFAGAAVTGSSAMLSEGIHSLVDTGDGLLLLVGMNMSQRPADERHPFGYGKDLYFWSLIVAVLIFGVGGGVSVYEGILHVLEPAEMRDPFWNYVTLGVAFVFEGASLAYGIVQFRRAEGGQPFARALRRSKDPSLYTVIAEDSAALLGVVAAALGVWTSQVFGEPVLDGVASIVIGLLLCGVASLLIMQARMLLVGAAVSDETAQEIRRIATDHAHVQRAAWPLTMYLGPEDVLLAMDIEFDPGLSAEEVQHAINSIERAIRERYSRVKRIYIEARRVTGLPAAQSIEASERQAHAEPGGEGGADVQPQGSGPQQPPRGSAQVSTQGANRT